jgi:hypothetical protein
LSWISKIYRIPNIECSPFLENMKCACYDEKPSSAPRKYSEEELLVT